MSAASESTTLARLSAALDCSDLINRFGLNVDNRNYDGVIDLFTVDCVIKRPGARFEGHAGLRDMLEARSESIQTLHLFSNLVVDFSSNKAGTGTHHFTLHTSEGPFDPNGAPIPIAPPIMAGEISDTFRNTRDGWRIATRSVRVIFADS